ncbi:SHV3-like 5 [Hibiscus syriacus]|uniref:SHV3-like 5 n=1 Tax=Hibiscus syriacus TaxID=106335 RepID=A0A6A3BYF7_HIBSY|nr:SHV3-like 5 [Hibiscus syriacus]
MERSPSWLRTLTIQLSLCVALFLVINFGRPQNLLYNHNRTPLDLYFISVRGGFRSIQQQTHLLKLMETVVKAYDVKFVVNICELGGMIHSCRTYTTGGSKRDGLGCFLQQIKLPGGEMLDIIGLNTSSLQFLVLNLIDRVSRYYHVERPYMLEKKLAGSSSGTRDRLSNWLTRTLKATISSCLPAEVKTSRNDLYFLDLRVVVGFHPLVACEEDEEQSVAKLINEPLHQKFVKFGVNVYLSQQGCLSYALQDSVAYISYLGLTKQKFLSDSANERYQARKEMTNGFLLHRLNSLEMVTYFVTSAGEIVNKIVVRQRGREIM